MQLIVLRVGDLALAIAGLAWGACFGLNVFLRQPLLGDFSEAAWRLLIVLLALSLKEDLGDRPIQDRLRAVSLTTEERRKLLSGGLE